MEPDFQIEKKDWVAIVVVTAILAGGYVIYKNQPPKYYNQEVQQPPTYASASQTAGFFINSLYATVVTYTDDGFSPTDVSIPKGGTVIFKNSSSRNVRVASNPHPSHDGYPTKDGCVGSTFDSCAVIPPNVSWTFAFDFPGIWDYHNHLNPNQRGTITVQ